MPVFLEIILLLCRLCFSYLHSIYRLFVKVPPKEIRGQVVVITGAGGGIGRALALKFAGHGAKLALWDIDESNNKSTAEAISSLGGTAYSYRCDVTSIESVKEAANQTKRDLGDVDILVNNAGILICKTILDLTERDIKRTMDINTTSHFWTVKEFLPKMLEKNSGHIVTICSMAGQAGSSLLTDYCASKFGAHGFTEALREELRTHYKKLGVKTSAVYPMFVGTNLLGNIAERIDFHDRFGKLMTPEYVTDTIMDGVLRDQRHIFVPPSARFNRAVGVFLPQSFLAYLLDFIDCRFVYKKKND